MTKCNEKLNRTAEFLINCVGRRFSVNEFDALAVLLGLPVPYNFDGN